jgi:beta-N-acetylhexosaminidase
MNLLQKAAQVLLLTIDGTALSPDTQALLAAGPPGGILLLERNVTGATQVRALTMALQRGAALVGSGVGLFVAVDQEGGLVQRIHEGVPAVPAARSLGDQSTPAAAAGLATKTAVGLVALGVNMNLAPVADVVDDRKSFLYQRTYGGDATLVAAFVAAVTEAFTRGGLISVVKHFPGHGSASGDSHEESAISNATQADFETVHLPPFRASIEAGAEGVMMAHLIATAYDRERPASQSAVVIDGLLRGDLGFAGLVVADDLEMAAAGAAGPGEAAVAALEAGCDLLISSGTVARQREVLEAIVKAVETGRLAPSRLDQAVLRVLALKLRHGIIASQP